MSPRFGSVFHSLGVRLLLPLSLTIGLVLAGYASLSFDYTRGDVMGLVRNEAQRTSGLIQRATHDGMLLNRLDDVQSTVERLAEAPDLAALRIYDKQGEVVISADRTEIGTRVAVGLEPCLSCHRSGAPLTTAQLEEIRLPPPGAQHKVLRHLSVIENEPGCATTGCHDAPAVEPVLGVLDIEMSTEPVDAMIESERSRLAWTTVVLLLIVVVLTTVFLRRMVQTPVNQLCAATRRIAGGELDTRVPVSGRHELAFLGEHFNRMAHDLDEAQRALKEWSLKLEAKVAEKTEELRRAERHVLQAEKMASLGRLCATVAHEINNPLSGVLTYARLVERGLGGQELDPETREMLDRHLQLIQRECARCGDIVKNLLLFARRRGAEMVPTDVNTVVERSLALVRHHLEMAGVEIHSEPLDGDAEIVADPNQLQQGLIDLLVNAAEAMSAPGQEGGELLVRVTGDAEVVWIEVRDTGVGMSQEVVAHVFEPFFSTKDDTSGVGLGLAVVYGIVRRHGGDIDVDSEPGRGTSFRIRLPRRGPTPDETNGNEQDPA